MPDASTQPLTVALLSSQARFRGGETQARLLALGLRQRGHRCLIYARLRGAFAQRMLSEGFEVEGFRGWSRGPAAIWRLRRWLRRAKPDVVHFNDSHMLTAGGLAALGLKMGGRVASRRVNFPLRTALQYRWLCDRVIAVSHAVSAVCQASKIDPRRLRVVHDGVDFDWATSGDRDRGRQSLGLNAHEILVLVVAALTEEKGHASLLQALPEVLRQHPAVCVALAGQGELRADLEQMARRLGIESRIRFLGQRDDVPDLLRAADLFVMPSHSEGLGSSVIDAMLARTPIVTTSAGGIAEIVSVAADQPPVAWVVPPHDPAALSQAVLAALSDPQERRGRVDRAEQRARALFSADRMVEATLAVYRELLAGAPSTACRKAMATSPAA